MPKHHVQIAILVLEWLLEEADNEIREGGRLNAALITALGTVQAFLKKVEALQPVAERP